MVEGVGTRGGHSPRDLIMQTDDLLTWLPPSPMRVKNSSRRRAPDYLLPFRRCTLCDRIILDNCILTCSNHFFQCGICAGKRTKMPLASNRSFVMCSHHCCYC